MVRYNLYPSAEVQGDTAPGYSQRPVARDDERLASKILPQGFAFEWTELAFQQKQAGNTGIVVFGLAVVFVFLLLAAQLRKPGAAAGGDPDRADVPAGGDPGRQPACGCDNNILTQIGLVVLIGLAAKNAILIVEFANRARSDRLDQRDAAERAARQRLRPILMTSIAFILGTLPLVIDTGPGSEMRQALGVAVFFGMIGVTLFGLLFTPSFYVISRDFGEWASQSPAGRNPEHPHAEVQKDALNRSATALLMRNVLSQRRKTRRPRTGVQAEPHQLGPRALGVIGRRKQLQVLRRDHPLMSEVLEVDDLAPVLVIQQHDRNSMHFHRLHQGENLEQFVQGAKPAGKDDQRVRPHGEVEFADREIVELKGQFGRRVGVWLLFHRQSDVEADARGADFQSATVGRFHDSRTAACRDDIVAHAAVCVQRAAALRRDAAEAPRFLVPEVGEARRQGFCSGRRQRRRSERYEDEHARCRTPRSSSGQPRPAGVLQPSGTRVGGARPACCRPSENRCPTLAGERQATLSEGDCPWSSQFH